MSWNIILLKNNMHNICKFQEHEPAFYEIYLRSKERLQNKVFIIL